jgi:hypothetical protein
MTSPHSGGTARRQVGRTPRETPASPASDRASPKTTTDAGDRWSLSNAIDDRLGWMPPRDRLVLRVLFKHANAKTGLTYPSTTTIGRAVGVHRAHVSRLLGRLVRWGVIEVVRRGHKGSRKAAEYRIRLPSEWPTEKPPD